MKDYIFNILCLLLDIISYIIIFTFCIYIYFIVIIKVIGYQFYHIILSS